MKNYLFALLAGAVLAGSCTHGLQQDVPSVDCSTPVSTTAPQAEVAALKQYIDTNKISATADARGFYYRIDTAGTGNKPTVCSDIQINYTGKLTNGTTFDSGKGVIFNLSNLILGWQEGLPLIAAGGRITLYLPPSLAYGARATGPIPANSTLIFDIKLLANN